MYFHSNILNFNLFQKNVYYTDKYTSSNHVHQVSKYFNPAIIGLQIIITRILKIVIVFILTYHKSISNKQT